MLKAIIFDLDGTLVQTEKLKAESYALAAVELCPRSISLEEAMAAFKEVVGLPRQEVARRLMARFDLEERARKLMARFQVDQPWQALIQVRLRIYEDLLADPEIIRQALCPHNAALVGRARTDGLALGLATMSHRPQAERVLDLLGLKDSFDYLATRESVAAGKPDPEIYLLVARELKLEPAQCLVIEDSPSGIKAALGAGAWCLAVTSDFTREAVHRQGLLNNEWVIDNPAHLLNAYQKMKARREED